MKFAIVANGNRPASDTVELAGMADAVGADEFWVTEDYFERGAFAVAGAVLARTEKIRVGVGVVNPWTRHPILTAMETAALSELGPGRVILGLGASNKRWMQDQLGIPFEKPLLRLEEALVMIRGALEGKHVLMESRGGPVDARLGFSIAGGVPIALGAKGRRALALADRLADSVVLSTMSSPAYVRWVRERMGPSTALAAYVGVSYDDDARAARERIKPFVAKYLGIHGVHDITTTAGLSPETANALRDGWLGGRLRTDLVTEEMIDVFCLAGSADDIRAGARRLADAGLDTLVLHHQGDPDRGVQAELLDVISSSLSDLRDD